MNMKKILLITPSNKGTIARCTLNLYMAFVQIPDVLCKVVCIHWAENGIPEFDNCEFFENSIGQFYKSVFTGIKRIIWLKKIKSTFSPDMSISMLPGCSTFNVLSGGDEKKIGVFHSPYTQIKHLRGQYIAAKLSYRFIYPHLDKFFCVSKDVMSFLLKECRWIKKEKYQVVRNVFNANTIKMMAAEPVDCLLPNQFVLSVGRIEPIKCPARLIRAYAASEIFKDGIHLCFIGEEHELRWCDMQHIVDELGISEFVHYLGFKSNPFPFISRALCLASSSSSEGLPGVLIESLILGVPVICTNSSKGVWEILSCEESYDNNLRGLFETVDGIITPNSNDEVLNINRMGEAITIMQKKKKSVIFPFGESINGENIVQEYLKEIKQ